MTDPYREDTSRPPAVARLNITITYLAPLKGQKTSKVRVETSGEVVKSQITDYSNQWTVWGGADGVLSDLEEPLRDWAAIAEDAQCRIWRAELSHRILTELAASPEGPRESELKRMLSELVGAVVPRPRPTPACRQLLASLDVDQVENAAWAVVRHAKKSGEIPEEAELIEKILDAVLQDMRGAT